jgi:hypothetical protein
VRLLLGPEAELSSSSSPSSGLDGATRLVGRSGVPSPSGAPRLVGVVAAGMAVRGRKLKVASSKSGRHRMTTVFLLLWDGLSFTAAFDVSFLSHLRPPCLWLIDATTVKLEEEIQHHRAPYILILLNLCLPGLRNASVLDPESTTRQAHTKCRMLVQYMSKDNIAVSARE